MVGPTAGYLAVYWADMKVDYLVVMLVEHLAVNWAVKMVGQMVVLKVALLG